MADAKSKRWHQVDACQAAFDKMYPARPLTGDEMKDNLNAITRGVWWDSFWNGWWEHHKYMNKVALDRKKKAKK